MITVLVVLVLALVLAAYFERKSLKADVLKAETKVAAATHSFIDSLRKVEQNTKLRISADIATLVSDVKAWEDKETISAKDAIAQIEARLKQIL